MVCVGVTVSKFEDGVYVGVMASKFEFSVLWRMVIKFEVGVLVWWRASSKFECVGVMASKLGFNVLV